MRKRWGVALGAVTMFVAACGAFGKGDDDDTEKPVKSERSDAAAELADQFVATEASVSIEAAADSGGRTQEVCTDFRKGPQGWTIVGDKVENSADNGFSFTLTQTRRGIAQSFTSPNDIHVSHVRLDWSFSVLSTLTLSTFIVVLGQTYRSEVTSSLASDGDLIVTGANGTTNYQETLMGGLLTGAALNAIEGNDFHLDTVWATAGSVSVQNNGGPAKVQVSTLNPETPSRTFVLDLGGTVSGVTGIAVTIRQACVSFE